MKSNYSIVLGIAAASVLALATTVALAHPGGWGPGAGPGAGYGMGYGMGGGCAGPGMMAQGGPFGASPLFTAEERTAFQEQMRSAKTVEERQKLMLEHRAEMQKRAADKGYQCPAIAATTGK